MSKAAQGKALHGHTAAWDRASWKAFTATQQADYPDTEALDRALRELAELPPLVTSWEILALRQQIAEAQRGERFFLQGGDCAESFAECNSDVIANRLKVLPGTFERQDYAIAMPLGSKLRKPINEQLVKIIQSPGWQRVLESYLGSN